MKQQKESRAQRGQKNIKEFFGLKAGGGALVQDHIEIVEQSISPTNQEQTKQQQTNNSADDKIPQGIRGCGTLAQFLGNTSGYRKRPRNKLLSEEQQLIAKNPTKKFKKQKFNSADKIENLKQSSKSQKLQNKNYQFGSKEIEAHKNLNESQEINASLQNNFGGQYLNLQNNLKSGENSKVLQNLEFKQSLSEIGLNIIKNGNFEENYLNCQDPKKF